ncbi:hypothetical protein ACN469_30975 [Corallococcus terminator]
MPDFIHVLLGLALGYVISSYVESFMHEYVSDARPKAVRAWSRAPWLFRPLINTHFSHHTIHHVRTFRNDHITQFRSEDEKQKLTEELVQRGKHGLTIIRGAFATRLHGEGAFVFVSPLVIFFPLFYFTLKPIGFLAGCVTLLLPPFMSHFVHPYLHRPFEEGQRTAPRWLAWFLGTRYGRAIYRNHFLHHRYGGVSNFNLVLGADYVRGRTRVLTPKDLEVMANIGMPLPEDAAVPPAEALRG